MINAGKYNNRIQIVKPKVSHDAEGFPTTVDKPVLEAYYYQVTGVETAMEPLIQTLKEKGIDYAIIP